MARAMRFDSRRTGPARGDETRHLGQVLGLRCLLQVPGERDHLVALVSVRPPVVAVLVGRVQVLELADVLLRGRAYVLREGDDLVQAARRTERADALVVVAADRVRLVDELVVAELAAAASAS